MINEKTIIIFLPVWTQLYPNKLIFKYTTLVKLTDILKWREYLIKVSKLTYSPFFKKIRCEKLCLL